MAKRSEAFRASAPVVAELAAGAVITHRAGLTVFLLHEAEEDRWCLPKGHVDRGESLSTAALREIREETGFDRVELEEELADVHYRFYDPRRATNVYKTVVYFLGRTDERKPHLEPIFDRFDWLPLEEAARRVGYESDHVVFNAARVRLGGAGVAPSVPSSSQR